MSIEKETEKIILPEKLQIKMLNFFLKTSIPRAKKTKELSEAKGKGEK